MAGSKTYTITLTEGQISALIGAAQNQLSNLDRAKYKVGNEGVTHYDQRMIGIRMEERLLRNAIERLSKKGQK